MKGNLKMDYEQELRAKVNDELDRVLGPLVEERNRAIAAFEELRHQATIDRIKSTVEATLAEVPLLGMRCICRSAP